MENGDSLLIEACRKYYFPKYYDENNDPMHGRSHIEDVLNLASMILDSSVIKQRVTGANVTRVILSVFIHDIFSSTHRKLHNVKAYEYVMYDKEDPFLIPLSKQDRIIIAYAVLQHRASDMPMLGYKDNFFSIEGEILASADRGVPSLDSVLSRARLKNETIDIKTINHIHEKYGVNGYIKFPELYKAYFGEEKISDFHKDVEEWYTGNKELVDNKYYLSFSNENLAYVLDVNHEHSVVGVVMKDPAGYYILSNIENKFIITDTNIEVIKNNFKKLK